MKRPVAVVLLAGAALLSWAPGAGAATPTGAWTDPSPSGTVGNTPLSYLQSNQPLKGHAEFSGGVASVTFSLVQDASNSASDPCSAAAAVKPQSVSGGSSRVDFAFTAPFPCNRRYEVRATATPTSRPLQNDTPLELDLWVAVAIPPATVRGLTAGPLADGARGVSLRWDSVTHEADFVGYQIRRAVGDGAFSTYAEVRPTATSYDDHVMPHDGATLRYEVVGMRPGPDGDTTVFADSGPSAQTTVGPVPTTTVPPSGGTSGSGGGGGVGGGGGQGSTAMPTGGGTQSIRREFTPPSTTVHEPTTLDTGFQQRLPFKPAPAASGGAPEASDSYPGAVAHFAGNGDGGRRHTLLLASGASVTFSWAMLLRFLSRRAAF